MNIETIRKMLHRAPFRPFQLHLTTGEVLPVGHAEQMALSVEEQMLSLFTADGWNLVEAESVKRISTEKRHKAEQKAGK